MLSWQDAYARLKPALDRGEHKKYLGYAPYALGALILIVFVSACRPFWMTNDDVSMAMIAKGTGIAASPSPRLVLTSIAWGYLAQWLPDIGGIEPYTLMTYAALGVSYLAVLYALIRSDVNGLFAAAVLLIIYAHTLVYPQYTLVAGYLAFAGIALACIPPDRQSIAGMYIAGLLLVLSGLVRADETVLVVVVALPACIGYWRAAAGSGIRRHWSIMIVATVAVFAAFQLWDAYGFSSGQWSEFGKTYMVRTEFTDFNLAGYYKKHEELLGSSGYSLNDLGLLSKWFYLDTQVFTPEKLGPLSAHLPLLGRLGANLDLAPLMLAPFYNSQVCGLLVITLLAVVYHQRGGYLLASLLALAAVMLALLLLGRPGVTRIYIPACAALALMGLMHPVGRGNRSYAFPVMLAVSGSILLLLTLHHRNETDIESAAGLQAVTCQLAGDPLVVVWGDGYPYTLEYRPFGATHRSCQVNIYSIGEYSLAPYALEQLHRVTGGRDLVPAMLAGQSFDFIAAKNDVAQLQQYFHQHYSADLSAVPTGSNRYFTTFRVGPATPSSDMTLGASL